MMNIFIFIKRSIKFYWRQHLAVFLGTLLSTAVLTGALVVGDSVRISLIKMVDTRLGNIQYILPGGERFFRAQLASELYQETQLNTAAILGLDAMVINNKTQQRINRVYVYGISDDFWTLSDVEMPDLNPDEAIINGNLAYKLQLKPGDEFLVRIKNTSVIPLNAPFVEEMIPTIAKRVKVKAVAGKNQMGRFSLRSNQTAPMNVFLSRKSLSQALDMEGKANLLLVEGNPHNNREIPRLNQALKKCSKLEDYGLSARYLPDNEMFEILSDRIFIDPSLTDTLLTRFSGAQTIITYLVNSLSSGEGVTPYSFVTAASSQAGSTMPVENEIWITEWLARDLHADVGDSLELKYYKIGPFRSLQEVCHQFIINRIIPTQDTFVNQNLMPHIPGLTDAGDCSDWETSIPVDLEKIRNKDEDFWNRYRGTPKALISEKTGKGIWENAFGSYTALRFEKGAMDASMFKQRVLGQLDLSLVGLQFVGAREEGIRAAKDSVDFAGLFIGLSFFVIVAGLLLLVLIFALHTESRMQESGILAGLGWRKKTILKVKFFETAWVTLLGVLAGIGVGILYNQGLLSALNSIWREIVRTDMLELQLVPLTLLLAGLISMALALASVYLVAGRKLKQAIGWLVKNDQQVVVAFSSRKKQVIKAITILGLAGALALTIFSVATEQVENAVLFLSAGGLLMMGMLASIYYLLKRSSYQTSKGVPGLFHLSLKNASRNQARSMTVIILLALGVFSFMITGANRKSFHGTQNNNRSGTGGFVFWGETTVPLIHDLNTQRGRMEYGLDGMEIIHGTNFMQLHTLRGDDASCLNLNQVSTPVILGVDPGYLHQKEAFTFVNISKDANASKPWLELRKSYGDQVIPAIVDQTVLTWGLKKKIGDTLAMTNERGQPINLLLVGSLAASVFQGNLLIDDSLFVKHFPSVGGSKTMLIDCLPDQSQALASNLQERLTDYGLELTPTQERLAEFYSVTNTYLTVFMILGGLGVMIGTLGLGIVLLRNILERKSEIALLQALGYKNNKIVRLMFLENVFLLMAGIFCGVLAAGLGILPSFLSPAFTIDLTSISVILLGIIITGFCAVYLPIRLSLKRNLIPALRNQ